MTLYKSSEHFQEFKEKLQELDLLKFTIMRKCGKLFKHEYGIFSPSEISQLDESKYLIARYNTVHYWKKKKETYDEDEILNLTLEYSFLNQTDKDFVKNIVETQSKELYRESNGKLFLF